MTDADPADWRVFHIGFGDDGLVIDGVDIWNVKWRPTGEPRVRLPHPAYPNQVHDYAIFEAGVARFAVDELSNGVWRFYVPVRSPNAPGRPVDGGPG